MVLPEHMSVETGAQAVMGTLSQDHLCQFKKLSIAE
jgi:hypothetical protein